MYKHTEFDLVMPSMEEMDWEISEIKQLCIASQPHAVCKQSVFF
jgi:hypothetical protein